MRGIMRTQMRKRNLRKRRMRRTQMRRTNLRKRRMHGRFVVSGCQTVASPGSATNKTVNQYGDLESEPQSTLESIKMF